MADPGTDLKHDFMLLTMLLRAIEGALIPAQAGTQSLKKGRSAAFLGPRLRRAFARGEEIIIQLTPRVAN